MAVVTVNNFKYSFSSGSIFYYNVYSCVGVWHVPVFCNLFWRLLLFISINVLMVVVKNADIFHKLNLKC